MSHRLRGRLLTPGSTYLPRLPIPPNGGTVACLRRSSPVTVAGQRRICTVFRGRKAPVPHKRSLFSCVSFVTHLQLPVKSLFVGPPIVQRRLFPPVAAAEAGAAAGPKGIHRLVTFPRGRGQHRPPRGHGSTASRAWSNRRRGWRTGAERRLPPGAATAHLPPHRSRRAGASRVGFRAARSEGCPAGDAPWGGRAAPACSAPVRHPPQWPTGVSSLREPPLAAVAGRPRVTDDPQTNGRGPTVCAVSQPFRLPPAPPRRRH